MLADARGWGVLTYIPEPDIGRRRWKTRPAEQRDAVLLNHRRVSRSRSKHLQKKRTERAAILVAEGNFVRGALGMGRRRISVSRHCRRISHLVSPSAKAW